MAHGYVIAVLKKNADVSTRLQQADATSHAKAIPLYSWHATQEHWGFSQGTTFSIVIRIILAVIAFYFLE